MRRFLTTVLVIEREAFSRFLIRHELEKRGLRVISARNKLEAADVLTEGESPDFVILGDLSSERRGPYRIVRLPNARARGEAARLAGHSRSPLLPRPLTAVDIAEAIVDLIEASPAPRPWWRMLEEERPARAEESAA